MFHFSWVPNYAFHLGVLHVFHTEPAYLKQISMEKQQYLLGKEGICSSTTRTTTEPPSYVSDKFGSSFPTANVNGKHHQIFSF